MLPWQGSVQWSWRKTACTKGTFQGMLCTVATVTAGDKWRVTGTDRLQDLHLALLCHIFHSNRTGIMHHQVWLHCLVSSFPDLHMLAFSQPLPPATWLLLMHWGGGATVRGLLMQVPLMCQNLFAHPFCSIWEKVVLPGCDAMRLQ